jgi:hypothetical protein
VDIAHRYRCNEIAIEQRRAGERKIIAADHRTLGRRGKTLGKSRNLVRFFAEVSGEGASEGIE